MIDDSGGPDGGSRAAPLPARREPNPQRVLNWLAIGLAAVSIATGVLHWFHYRRVGNSVTALLPRDTIAYVRVGRLSAVRARLETLDAWTRTLPIRELIEKAEEDLLVGGLYNLNVTRHMLESLEAGLGSIHAAAVHNGGEQDYVFVLEFADRQLIDAVESRVFSAFEDAGEEGGVRLRKHKGGRPLWGALADGLAVFVVGHVDTLHSFLSARERSPNRSLNDDEGFRAAWATADHTADLFGYARGERAIQALVDRAGPAVAALERPLGASVRVALTPGADRTQVGIYTATGALHALSEATGLDRKRTLSTVPSTARFAIALSVHSPGEIFDRLRELALDGVARLFGLARSEIAGGLNRAQAESGHLLSEEVWPRLAGEVALAMIPAGAKNAPADWLLVLAARDPESLLETIVRLTESVLDVGAGSPQKTHYSKGLYRFGIGGIERVVHIVQ